MSPSKRVSESLKPGLHRQNVEEGQLRSPSRRPTSDSPRAGGGSRRKPSFGSAGRYGEDEKFDDSSMPPQPLSNSKSWKETTASVGLYATASGVASDTSFGSTVSWSLREVEGDERDRKLSAKKDDKAVDENDKKIPTLALEYASITAPPEENESKLGVDVAHLNCDEENPPRKRIQTLRPADLSNHDSKYAYARQQASELHQDIVDEKLSASRKERAVQPGDSKIRGESRERSSGLDLDQGRNPQALRPGAVPVSGPNFTTVDPPVDVESAQRSAPAAVMNASADPVPMLEATAVDETVSPRIFDAIPLSPNWAIHKKTERLFLLLVLFVLIAAVTIGLVVWSTLDPGNNGAEESQVPTISPAPTTTPMPTVQSVREEGVLRCGVNTERAGLSSVDADGERIGFEIDLCRAVAAAVMGESSKMKAVPVPQTSRFTDLADKRVDLVIRVTTHTMERDVYQSSAKTGFAFSVPYLYEGLKFGGIPSFVSCAESLAEGNTISTECDALKICTLDSSTHLDILRDRLSGSNIVTVNQTETTRLQKFLDGECNVIAGAGHDVSASVAAEAGYTESYEVGTKLFSKEPSAIMTRDDDPQWSDFVNWVLQALMAAEQQGITQSSAHDFGSTSVFGETFKDMFVNAIAEVGNYGAIYARHLEHIVPRPLLNTINNGETGLIYSLPFGSVSHRGAVAVGGTLERIKTRGHLRCGISRRPGFGDNSTGQWAGIDADYCRAVSAGVFSNTRAPVEFVEISEDTSTRFGALAGDEVDVLSGSSVTLETDVLEPSTGEGYTFSQPYFYSNASLPPMALATRQDDSSWSAFVFWIVTCTFFAEEEGITQTSTTAGTRLPLVELFGSGSERRMFRDAILAVGNYGEIYQRNLESLFPRQGFNLLNVDPFGPQQYPLF